MTSTEKEKIKELYKNGYGYKRISDVINLSPNTVKTYIRRHKDTFFIVKDDGKNIIENIAVTCDESHCKNCGKELVNIKNHKKKIFCSDKCRYSWWGINRSNKVGSDKRRCIFCNNIFFTSKNSKRKYCSHDCYIKDRFRGNFDGK